MSRQNQSILNFFGKARKNQTAKFGGQEESLFYEECKSNIISVENSPRGRSKSPSIFRVQSDTEDNVDLLKFNESPKSVKRKRLSESPEEPAISLLSPAGPHLFATTAGQPDRKGRSRSHSPVVEKPLRHRGGFVVDDSSSDEEEVDSTTAFTRPVNSEVWSPGEPLTNCEIKLRVTESLGHGGDGCYDSDVKEPRSGDAQILSRPEKVADPSYSAISGPMVGQPMSLLSREATSVLALDEFGPLDDFNEDEFFEGGEEMMERRWMEEQREFETGLDEDSKSESGEDGAMTPITPTDNESAECVPANAATCPICGGSLRGATEAQASGHVNSCLDGRPTSLPALQVKHEDERPGQSSTAASAPRRFQRAAIARPGQQNPYSIARSDNKGSAFSRLMSGHAEDAAWAEAASNEAQSRGRPAYERTCPFYKIMPGLYICVDAFRYGKVEGQNAYFLSHFHSDHYIGLTSSWCHGPIYCSKVTANLVRQQLRVDPKYVVSLEFEEKVEIPNTKGVSVTMLPANHCPGSSLYLFEKVVGIDKAGKAKLNRILHCGDFRACPAHVQHPLLKPDVIDTITGQTKAQTIDTCYLDTTYLTPKYAFPSQQDVIDACAQMCVSLSKEIVDTSDEWEKVNLERAGSTMNRFLERGNSDTSLVKTEESEDKKPASRGRLLVVIGTYSIGKERICLGIAKALNSKIYAPPGKMRICACLEDAQLNARLTSDPLEAQVHMQTLMEIRAETLLDYCQTYSGHFTRVVGFRPTGWNYRPPTSRFTENPAVSTVLHSEGWKSRFTMKDLAPGRGSTRESHCFGVPYSEHSSFRELSMFCCALRIGRIIPTVNVGSPKSRERMKGWIEKWDAEKKKNGLFKVETGQEGWGSGDGALRYGV